MRFPRLRQVIHNCKKPATYFEVQRSNLKRHEKEHLAPRNHYCTLCDKSFKSKGNLLSHQKVHIRPVRKSNSNIVFIVVKASISMHIPVRSSHWSNYRECRGCNNQYMSEISLKKLLKQRHKEHYEALKHGPTRSNLTIYLVTLFVAQKQETLWQHEHAQKLSENQPTLS